MLKTECKLSLHSEVESYHFHCLAWNRVEVQALVAFAQSGCHLFQLRNSQVLLRKHSGHIGSNALCNVL
jgi:hypothetical protein